MHSVIETKATPRSQELMSLASDIVCITQSESKAKSKAGSTEKYNKRVGSDDAEQLDGHPTMTSIATCFDMPIEEAAKKLGVGVTVLKKHCRKLQIERWPYRKRVGVRKTIKQITSEVDKMGKSCLPSPLALQLQWVSERTNTTSSSQQKDSENKNDLGTLNASDHEVLSSPKLLQEENEETTSGLLLPFIPPHCDTPFSRQLANLEGQMSNSPAQLPGTEVVAADFLFAENLFNIQLGIDHQDIQFDTLPKCDENFAQEGE